MPESRIGGNTNTLTSVQKDNLVAFNSKALNETIAQNKLTHGEPKALDLYNRKAQDISPTLTEPHHNSLRLYDWCKIRRLTEIECERLQGFPDNWTALGDYDGVVKPVPKTQRYKQCGNAVTVDIVRLVGSGLIKYCE